MLHNTPKARFPDGLFSPFSTLWNALIDLVFPPRCEHCGRVDTSWCDACLQELEHIPITPLARQIESFTVLATAPHEGVLQSAIHALKYANQPHLAQRLGLRLAQRILNDSLTFDRIIPVPLHITRQAKRGYNQSKELALALSLQTGIPVAEDFLQRQRETRPQVGLSRQERLTNVAGAFVASHTVSEKRLLVIDDVCTTGSTLKACAEALYQQGAIEVMALTLSMAKN